MASRERERPEEAPAAPCPLRSRMLPALPKASPRRRHIMADLGPPLAPPFAVAPHFVWFLPERKGLFDWIYELIVALRQQLIGLFFAVGIPLVAAGIVYAIWWRFLPEAAVAAIFLGAGAAGLALFVRLSVLGAYLAHPPPLQGPAEVDLWERGVRAKFIDGRVIEVRLDEITALEGVVYPITPGGRSWGESCRLALHTEADAAGRPVLELWGDWPGKLPPDHPIRVLCQR